VARFSAATLSSLERAGWRPGRSTIATAWVRECVAGGYVLHGAGDAALREFGGLCVEPSSVKGPNFSNDEPFMIDPTLVGSGFQGELGEAIGGGWWPIGEWLSNASVLMRQDGLVVAAGFSWVWKLGDSMDDAIEFAVRAHRPLECLAVVDEGVDPWPPKRET
jgi:hypothetical protein